MELAGEVVIGGPPHRVWAALNDPAILRQCIPGCEDVQQVSPTETHTRVLMKMGPVRARFVGKILMSDIRPDAGCTLNFEGSGGAAGFARGSSVVNLVAEGNATRLHYSASASIGGKLGQIGGRMIDASAKQMADQFFRAFQAQVDEGEAASPVHAVGTPPAVASALPNQRYGTGFGAAGFATATPAAAVTTSERVRVLWFLLGMTSTGFGVWLAGRLAQ